MTPSRTFAGILCLTSSVTIAAPVMPIYAHRGASAYAPENTTPAVQLAWEMKADAVELDTWISSDGRVMVIHDGDTSRTAQGVQHSIKKTPADVLRKLDVSMDHGEKYKGTVIPFLEEFLEMLPPGKEMVLEFKDDVASVEPIRQVLEKSGKMKQVVLIGFKLDVLTAAHKAMPGLKTYYLATAKKGVTPKAIDPDVIREAKEAGFDGVNLDHRYLTEELAKKTRDAGLALLAWTVDKPEDVERVTKLGIDAITTNKPDTTRETLTKLTK
ncbi:MAG: glycerophosphodiester phosphodiesterase family protein [Candidatus Sumerlaeaceae bacterium]